MARSPRLALAILSIAFLAQPRLLCAPAPKGRVCAATTPIERTDPLFHRRRRDMAARRGDGPIRLLFLGDSITQRWDRALWDKHYGPRQAANFGIDADRTEHVLWRLRQGDVDGLSPEVIVLLIGVNNCRRDPSADIAAGISAIVDELRTRCPKSRILLLGIFPVGQEPNVFRDRLGLTNVMVARLADGEHVHVLDIGDRFLRPDDSISPDIMPDFLHLSPEGYRVLASALEPHLRTLLGEEP